ncbi:fibronectin-binding autotransporter adhesin ShdA [Salmonella enterica subsp. enterica serovar Herston]|uniref:Fibronectin-binding autotransporter adhesin ShdA n=1 Tax=Salmonella enterica TaxID=28901 RepID=A0A744FYR5_SALER|nr:fibronectin-binding autotransporter adhesin ShdA [Salmonella enterica]EAW1632496.1 fibronectin-binding autotransporter adhesin ShdA [Salmonella enterica subsp. enterica]EBY7391561.1 fibronectin-binding autotransporter adhesin ShdA [Salmonella enterica subsp. enterica serovar Herston]EAZ4930367.1 fibronectin-binding autotransporter adhesin ShdA [Salmonella enterica]EBI4241087.1 fibronectin-binding autotransporter adhesin ShdA [Salmonella enterica]EBP6797574.1 fibronectin-binding autotranspor
MNRTYSIVWSAVRNMYVVASELARGHSKVKAQVCASETHSPNKKSEYGQIIKATRNVLACAVAAALGFFSPLAMADNQVSYADAQTHVLDKSTPAMTYSGVEDGAALYVSGVATVGWQSTTVKGTGLVIETTGGGANAPDGGKYVSKAISIDHYAILELTDTEITTDSIYSLGISAADGSTLTLTDSTLNIGGNYGVMTLYTGSAATLNNTTVEAANSSSAQVQQGSTLNVLDGSKITLAQGQINVVAGTTAADAGSTLNLSDSSVISAGTMSTIQGSNKADLNLTNATITHNNASGAAVQANNATTLDISGGNITSAGTGVYILASDANIDGATINADGDGIFITSKKRSTSYEDLNALTVSDANVTSKTVALNVDGSTTINDPIKLTNSTFTAPTAIKLGSKATIQAENMTLTGNIVQTDMSSSSLSLSQESTLTGRVDAMFTTLSLDDTSQWNMTDPSTVGNLTNNGGITLNNASGSTGTLLTVGDTLTLQDGSQINATLDTANSSPIIKAANVTLDGTLNLSSTATFVAPETDEHFGSVTLIDSQTAITTDFDSVTLDADTSAMPDYLTINAGVDANDNTNYELSTGLSWYAGANSARAAHGTFTVDADSTFTVTSELDETTATSNWDGSKLTKQGDGTLILSNTGNDYGDTVIDGGILAAKDAASLGTGDVTIAENATLALSQGTLDNNVTGEGQIVKSGSDELIVTGDNNYSGGTTISGGTLTADHADSLGSGDIDNSGVLQVGEGELKNTLFGSGSLVKTGTGVLTLSGDNTYSGGTTISDGTLIADHADSLGSGDIDNSGVLKVGEGELKNTLSGSGSLVKTGTGELTLSGDNNTYFGDTTIAGGTLIAANVNALGSGNIDNSGTLMLDANGAFKLANITTHSGATTALAAGSTLYASQLTQENGSTLSIDLGAATDDAMITADSVTLGGTLNISGIGNVTDSWTPEAYTYTLIDSDSAITSDFDDLTIAGMNREDVDFLTIDGKVDETDNTHYDLTASLSWYADRDNATTDAHGTFTLSDPDGSFNVAATLTDVDDTLDPGSRWDGKSLTKEGAGTLILSGDNDYSGGTTINEGTLVAASTTALGTGLVDNNATLVLDADGEVSAAGGITTHSGATTQLALGTSLDLGDSALIQQDGSTLNVELNSDSVQPLITGGSATLGGDLVVSDASLQARASDAEFQSFKLMDMDSDISGDFTSLTMNLTDQPDYLTVTGTINPEDASEYLLTEGLSWNATATSATPAHGTFTLGAGDSFEVTSVLGDKTGNGDWDGKSLTKLGAGKLTLSGANTYSGDTNVQEGTLWLAGDGTIGEVGSQQAVNVASGATFGGSNGTTVNGKVTNEGTLVFGDSEETGAIFTLNGDLINMGTMTSGSSASTPGNTLYVDGNYTGNGGSLYLNTVLGDDDSATDKLVITGDASGTTDLYINGIGDGAQTTNGIEVVDVGGVSTSDAFELKNEVNAGLYTYRLYWNESDNDWYLASKAQSDDDDSGGDDTPSDGGDDGGNVTPPDDGGDGGNVTPPDDGGDGGDVTPPDDGGDVAPQYRADIGAYMGNQWMARNLQMQTLYDREGSQYRNADGSVWARFKAGKAESEAVSGNIDMDSNYSQFQLGGDILAWGNGQQSVTVGVMASYINADTDSTGNRGADGSQFTSSGNVDGYNLGVYATWFADAQTHSGAYVDSWYQYGFYNNSVESGDAGSESYDSTANAVSLETGYRYDIALSNGNTVSLTPQAQVVWQNYSADSVKDNYGTRIDGQDGDSWTTRLGLRVDGKLYKGSRTVIQPFAEANWLHTSDDVSVSFDDATVKQDLPANRAELKVGLQADIDKQWSVRAQVAGQTGSNDFGDLNGSLNLRYNW